MILGQYKLPNQNSMNISDLPIEKDILPLFDYTLNGFSKQVLLEIFRSPLSTNDKINERHEILKGFTVNHAVLKDYSYSVSYLTDVYYFINSNLLNVTETNSIKYKLLTSKFEKRELQNKLTQAVLLFNRLQVNYFSRLNLTSFPPDYRKSIEQINYFFECLSIEKYGILIQDGKFKTTHIIALSRTLMTQKAFISIFWKNLFLFEAYLSINQGILKNNFAFSELSQSRLELHNFYYPLIENSVLNNLETNANVIVITGPNMSGKSTLLKAIGLCIYLAQLGIAVPASQAIIPFYSEISISINHKDDIESGYSHFMTEVMNLKEVVKKASDGASVFAVFDELFSGTNQEDALEICTTTINGLAKFKNSLFLISTHIQKLKDTVRTSNKSIETFHIDCKLEDNTPQFTYLLTPGWSNLKVGRILFNNVGLADLLT